MESGPKNQTKLAESWSKIKAVFVPVFVPVEENQFLPKALNAKYLFWYGAGLLLVKILIVGSILILPSTNFYSSIAAERLAYLINQERQSQNLEPLSFNATLNSTANLKINDMLAQDYFEHISPAGIAPWFWFKQAGYNYEYAGENLAMDFFDTDKVFAAWMNSPTHRDNILNPNYREMGLAVKAGQVQDHEATLAVLVFGSQAQTKTIAKTSPSPPAQPKVSATPQPTMTPATTVSIQPTTPAASPQIIGQQSVLPSPAAAPTPEQIAMKTTLGNQTGNFNQPITEQETVINTGYAPQVLGAFVSKSDEIFKSLYLYFTLFLSLALLVNIFVKIKVQYWPTISATTFIILLATALIFI